MGLKETTFLIIGHFYNTVKRKMKPFKTFIAEAKKKPPPIKGWFKEKDNDEPNHDNQHLLMNTKRL